MTNPLLPVDLNTAAQAQQTNGPTGPYTVTMFHVMGPNQSVEVSGMVTGPNAANLIVEFEGPMTGYVVTDANGAFSFTTNASFLGTELAGVVSSSPAVPTLLAVRAVEPYNPTWLRT